MNQETYLTTTELLWGRWAESAKERGVSPGNKVDFLSGATVTLDFLAFLRSTGTEINEGLLKDMLFSILEEAKEESMAGVTLQ